MIKSDTVFFILFLCGVTYLLGMFLIPLMDIDAAQYASISREMLERKSYLQFYDLGGDYLDKPPMLFWLSGLSMKLFGIHDWAYRLPSFLFAWLSVYSTYRLALLYYKREIALLSAMVLAASQAMFLIMHDVRTDTILMGWVIWSLWQLAEWYQHKRWSNFILAFIGIAGGMLTKGPIALMVPVFAFVPHFILRREWKQFFRWQYIIAILIVALALLPMSIGLYQQYDLHPGKMINGEPIKSGLRFYYWTQSFGRYTGENHFKEMNDFTFLLQNMLWSFLPWIIFFLIGLFFDIFELIQDRFKLSEKQEWITTGGFIITYCVLGRSQAQLPHYIFVVFPLASIITAKFLYRLTFTRELSRLLNVLQVFHVVIFTLLWIALVILMAYPFPGIPKYVAAIAGLCLIGMYLIFYFKKPGLPHLLGICFFTIIGINLFLNTVFYPTLLKFQKGSMAAAFIIDHQIPVRKVVIYGNDPGHSFHFYGKHIFPSRVLSQLETDNVVYTEQDSLISLIKKFPQTKILYQGRSYGVTQLSLPFLNPATRSKEVGRYVIVSLAK
jgi:4-amino-4-deoxy-L-arabinose transferase-like glycosyltransferase